MESARTLTFLLYGHLCNIVGTERVVQARRLYFTILDDAINSVKVLDFFTICSGSKAEGLDIPGSDIDVMHVICSLPVHTHTDQSSHKHTLCYDTDNSLPGFAYLKICSEIYGDICCSKVHTEMGTLLSSDKFKQYFLDKENMNAPFHKLHGPCVANFNDQLDIAYCVRCRAWPSIASSWIKRSRASGWPPSDLITNILEEGIIFVPIGGLAESSHNDPNSWRISFSVAEKMLIHSFNHTQFLCYALLKFVLKEDIDINCKTTNLLCSYFLKTVLFWRIEDVHRSMWTPGNLFKCFQQCIKRLIYFVKCGYCPNYFIPENNIFKGKIYGEAQKNLEDILKDRYNEGIMSVLQCQSLKDFRSFQTVILTTYDAEVDSALYPLLHVTPLVFRFSREDNFIYFILNNILNRMYKVNYCYRKQNVSHRIRKLVKDIYIDIFLQSIGKYATSVSYDYRLCNKTFYPMYKQFSSLLLIGVKHDLVSGWLTVALFLYQQRQYGYALTITKYVKSECCHDKLVISPVHTFEMRTTLFQGRKLSFAERHKLSCVHGLNYTMLPHLFLKHVGLRMLYLMSISATFTDNGQWTCLLAMLLPVFLIMPTESIAPWMKVLGQIKPTICSSRSTFKGIDMIQTSPFVFTYFMLFMCYHNLQDIEQRQNALAELFTAVENDCFSESLLIRWNNLGCMMKAIEIAGFGCFFQRYFTRH